MNLKAVTLASLLLASMAVATGDAVKIQWKPKAGSTAKYKLNVKATSDALGGDILIGISVASKILEVKADGTVVVEEKQSDFSIKAGGQDVPGPDAVTSTSTMSPRGEVLSHKTDSQMESGRMDAALEFVYPDKDVNAGDSWTVKKDADKDKGLFNRETTYTFDGTEKVGKWDCYRIKVSFKETSAPTNMTYTATVWVATDDGTMIKGNYDMKSVEFGPGMPPTDATSEIMRTE